VVKLLLATDKVDPNAKDKGGRTPLSRGVAMGVKAMVELLSATGQVQETQKQEYDALREYEHKILPLLEKQRKRFNG
jgi:Ankyrin repeats (many copies)